jgi:60 kDa SS-A/Ro ribonucleoprotein
MRTNIRNTHTLKTHEGAPAAHLSPIQQLRRSVMACMLWEDSFYEDGQSIADRIQTLANQLNAHEVAEIAVEARTKFKLRHAPLLLASALAKKGGRVTGQTIEQVIQRADELAEFLSIYWRNGKTPLSKQVKVGLARAFRKFDAYALAKYNRDNAVKLRDVLFLCHAKPKDEEQAAIWKQLVDGTLAAPDTWEVALSGGADKKETFERLLRDGKLGYMALLRNLRNMVESGVDSALVEARLAEGAAKSKALPFRFVAALRAAPSYANALNSALLASLGSMERLPGKTVVLIDVSGSMDAALSRKSDLSRIDAAAALGALVSGISNCRVLTFSQAVCEVPGWAGLPLIEGIIKSQPHGGTYLGQAVQTVVANIPDYDRLIVITDEQSHDRVDAPHGKRNYMINVACEKNGVGYGNWIRIDGFSEAIVEYIKQYETSLSD